MYLRNSLTPAFKAILFAALAAAQFNCDSVVSKSPDSITAAVDGVREEYCPDRRLCVFDIEVTMRGSNIYLKGEADDPAAIAALTERAKSASEAYKVEIDVRRLPDETVASDTFGVAKQSVVSMRAKPTDSSELVNQILLGHQVKLLKRDRTWFYAQTNDGYLGWVYGEFLQKGDALWLGKMTSGTRLVFLAQIGKVYREASDSSLAVSEITAGALMKGGEKTGDWVRVQLPDARQGFVYAAHLDTAAKVFSGKTRNRRAVIAMAKSFLGQPYLWGGNSPKGFDCSGFTQTVFKRCGLELLRDASLQARQGNRIAPGRNFENLLPGDLVFFTSKSGRVTHVGIYIGDKEFIHSSGRESVGVTINSFDPQAPSYSKYRHDSFHGARRIRDLQS